MANRQQRIDFVNKYLPRALECCFENGYHFAIACTCISQSALETGWGLSGGVMIRNNALHGIKGIYKDSLGREWFYEAPTKEYINGQWINTIGKFRSYPTIKEGFNDYFNSVLKQNNFKDVFKHDSVRGCITALKKGNYATDPNYIDNVLAVWGTICNDLKG